MKTETCQIYVSGRCLTFVQNMGITKCFFRQMYVVLQNPGNWEVSTIFSDIFQTYDSSNMIDPDRATLDQWVRLTHILLGKPGRRRLHHGIVLPATRLWPRSGPAAGQVPLPRWVRWGGPLKMPKHVKRNFLDIYMYKSGNLVRVTVGSFCCFILFITVQSNLQCENTIDSTEVYKEIRTNK